MQLEYRIDTNPFCETPLPRVIRFLEKRSQAAASERENDQITLGIFFSKFPS